MLRKRDLLWIAAALVLAAFIMLALGHGEGQRVAGEGSVIGDPF